MHNRNCCLFLTILAFFGLTDGISLATFSNRLVVPQLTQTDFYVDLDITATTTSAAGVGDGYNKPIVAINGGIPGPTIVVWQGSKVYVNVRNFLSEPTTIHFHGLDQKDNFWYDGVPNINQCPIPPGGTFQYEIQAVDNPGTYWYHSHAGSQRGDGCYGAFIILEKSKYLVADTIPQEFVVILQDWWRETAGTMDNAANALTIRDATGIMASDIKLYSIIVNGKGQKHQSGTPSVVAGAKMEVFRPQSCSNTERPVRFRVISAGITWALTIQIAGHRLRFLASDGQDTASPYETFDTAIINSGERYDFELVKLPSTAGYDGFRIKIGTTADSTTSPLEDLSLYYSEALLSCSGLPPPSNIYETQTVCTAAAKCKVLNCPFKDYPSSYNKVCTNAHQFKALHHIPTALLQSLEYELFINIGTIESQSFFHINRIKMTQPTYPPYEEYLKGGNVADVVDECAAGCGDTQQCECFKPITFATGKLNQIVIYNKIDKDTTSAVDSPAMGHPFHFHAYHMYVLKTGYPSYDANGKVDQVQTDVVCDNTICTNGHWASPPTDLNLVNPAYKDTVFVPANGYVVVRFISDNVGWFVMHCHMAVHEGNGLMAAIQTGDDVEVAALVRAKRPSYYHSCTVDENAHYCSYTGWSAWSGCERNCEGLECGTEVRSRSRTENSNPAHCMEISEKRTCNQDDSCECGNHCEWSAWSDYTSCTTACGEGVKSRSRHLQSTPPGNAGCSGTQTDVQPCSAGQSCFEGVVARFCATADGNGFYPVGDCSSLYIACMGAQSTHLFCPSGMKFDHKHSECRLKELVKDC